MILFIITRIGMKCSLLCRYKLLEIKKLHRPAQPLKYQYIFDSISCGFEPLFTFIPSIIRTRNILIPTGIKNAMMAVECIYTVKGGVNCNVTSNYRYRDLSARW